MFGEYAVNLINVSDEVHDDRVEPAPVRQVVPLLDIDPQQFVVVKEEQVVTEQVHGVGDVGQGHRHPDEGVRVRHGQEGGVERVHAGAEPEEPPGSPDHPGEVVILVAVAAAGGRDQLAGVLHGPDELVVPRPARVQLEEGVQHRTGRRSAIL